LFYFRKYAVFQRAPGVAEKTFGSVRRKSKKGNKHKNIEAIERDVFGAVSFFALTTN